MTGENIGNTVAVNLCVPVLGFGQLLTLLSKRCEYAQVEITDPKRSSKVAILD